MVMSSCRADRKHCPLRRLTHFVFLPFLPNGRRIRRSPNQYRGFHDVRWKRIFIRYICGLERSGWFGTYCRELKSLQTSVVELIVVCDEPVAWALIAGSRHRLRRPLTGWRPPSPNITRPTRGACNKTISAPVWRVFGILRRLQRPWLSNGVSDNRVTKQRRCVCAYV